MKLMYYRGRQPNFGDELNTYLWPRLFGPGFFDDDDREMFIGIGSIIGDYYPAAATKAVVGSGYGGYTPLPTALDQSWRFHFVRGPRTAQLLGLGPEAAITDAAVLIRTVPTPPAAAPAAVSFIPHFESLDRGNWRKACALAGIQLIDPTDPVDSVLAQIRGSGLVITEAMHGAIVADALRVPWTPVVPTVPTHRFKWLDWTESLGISYRPARIFPSSLREAWVRLTGRSGDGRRARALGGSVPARVVDRLLVERAATSLARAARQAPHLSDAAVLDRAIARAAEAVERFRH
jgi:succinoglycan biosynthesis protein ExoV